MQTLRTARLVLDAPRESDIDAVLAACQDEQTQRWVPLPTPYTRQSAEFFVRSYCPHGLAARQYTVWALREGPTGVLLGVIEVRRDETRGSASLGCWLAPQARGRGLMREALGAVASYSLDARGLGFTRLRWEYLPGNEGSRRLAESAGFAFDGATTTPVAFRGVEEDALVGFLRRGEQRPAGSGGDGPAHR